jgi:hypothetical protein
MKITTGRKLAIVILVFLYTLTGNKISGSIKIDSIKDLKHFSLFHLFTKRIDVEIDLGLKKYSRNKKPDQVVPAEIKSYPADNQILTYVMQEKYGVY